MEHYKFIMRAQRGSSDLESPANNTKLIYANDLISMQAYVHARRLESERETAGGEISVFDHYYRHLEITRSYHRLLTSVKSVISIRRESSSAYSNYINCD